MPRVARRTLSKVKSWAMMPRQPLVPNLMGVAMAGCSWEWFADGRAERFPFVAQVCQSNPRFLIS